MVERAIVYICGPITNDPEYKEKFGRAESYLKSLGYIVLNPTVLPQDLPYEKYFPPCFGMIDIAHNLYMLKDWQKSDGANREYLYAQSLRKDFIFEV